MYDLRTDSSSINIEPNSTFAVQLMAVAMETSPNSLFYLLFMKAIKAALV